MLTVSSPHSYNGALTVQFEYLEVGTLIDVWIVRVESSWKDLTFLEDLSERWFLSLCCVKRIMRTCVSVCKSEKFETETQLTSTLILDFRTVRNKLLLLKSPALWCCYYSRLNWQRYKVNEDVVLKKILVSSKWQNVITFLFIMSFKIIYSCQSFRMKDQTCRISCVTTKIELIICLLT